MTPSSLPRWLLWSSLVVAVALACYERRQTRFPHELHLAKLACDGPGQPNCLTCASCHGGAREREPQGLPGIDRCSSCHESDAEEMLHRSVRPSSAPAPIAHEIAFTHQTHLEMPKIQGQCVPCHSGAVTAQSTLFPPMNECFSCHEHQEQFAAGECGPCHAPGDVQSLVPQTFMRHDSGWLRAHGPDARTSAQVCSTCHTQAQCDDCHDPNQRLSLERREPDAIDRSMVHRADFLTRHALDARSQPARCLTCHTQPTCDGCHLERGVSANALGALNPHPAGWAIGNPVSKHFHGRAARRDLLGCASCHDQGPLTNCIRCHQVGGFGGNPHPNGWRSARSENSSMCRYCHGR